MARVRYFAAAAEAAGLDEETIDAVSFGELSAEIVRLHGPGLEAVLRRCSLLVDGVRTDGADAAIADAATVDVLPPFAGG
ncbi:MoaD/ThiS family protein [Luethyella okanaganae]|uniref:MoaD/ThiS family protein n=1 Tax=Luethyella okanaganae TaxID=69372 RepID=A0ABW1V9A4_9MICO